MHPVTNVQIVDTNRAMVGLSFDTTYDSPLFSHALMLVVEQDGTKDQWEIRRRPVQFPAVGGGGINSDGLDFYNVTKNKWWNQGGSGGDEDDTGNRRYMWSLPTSGDHASFRFGYNPSQPDASSMLRFYVVIAIVAPVGGHAAMQLGETYTTEAIPVRTD